ncbi:MAG: hypothetical protein ACR2PR_09445 [Pseudohongiellaceae bacterium]
MADLTTENLDTNVPIAEALLDMDMAPLTASAYFEDYLFKIIADLNAINDEVVGGSVTDGANVGGFSEVFQEKSGSILEFRTIQSSDGSVTITQNADDLDLQAVSLAGTVANSILTYNLGTSEYTELPQFRVSFSGGVITIAQDDSGGGAVNAIISDGDGAIQIGYDGTTHFQTNANGADVPTTGAFTIPVGTTAQEPAAVNGMLRYDSDTNELRAVQSGAWVDVIGGGGGALTQFQDNGLFGEGLYDTFVSFSTDVFGILVNGVDTDTQPRINFLDAPGGTQVGNIRATSTGMVLDNRRNGPTLLRALDAAVSVVNLFDGDPDGSADLFFDGDANPSMVTINSGISIRDADGAGGVVDAPFIEWENADGSQRYAFIQANASTGILRVNTTDLPNSMHHQFTSHDSSGIDNLMLELDPDGAAGLYFDGDLIVETTNQGFQSTAVTGTAGVLQISADVGQVTAINFEEGTFTNFQVAYFPGTSLGHIRMTNTGEDFHVTNLADGDMARFLGGGAVELLNNNVLVFNTTTQGIQTTAGTGIGGAVEISADAGQTTQINFEEATTTHLQLAWLAATNLGRLRITDTTDDFLITNLADGDMARFNGGAGSELYFNNTLTLSTSLQGIRVIDGNGNDDPFLRWYNSANSVQLATAGVFNDDLFFINDVTAGLITLRAQGTAPAADADVLIGDPDGDTQIFDNVNNAVAFESRNTGMTVQAPSGNNANIFFEDGDAQTAFISKDSDGEFTIRNQEDGMTVRIEADDLLADAHLMFDGDPDDAVDLYFNDLLAFSTHSTGVEVVDTSGDNPAVQALSDAGVDEWQVGKNATGAYLFTQEVANSVSLIATATGVVTSVMFEGDPDVGVAFNAATPFAAPTYTPTNVTTDRAFDANAAAGAITNPPTQAEVENIRDAVLELADVLGTLIDDLTSYGLLV